jgi:gamma-glutamylcysteine synthetase
MRRLDADTAADFAEAMGWKRGAERTVARWLSGVAKPSFGYVMEMVERAGLLETEGASVVRIEPEGDLLAPEERRQLAANDESILANQDAAMKILEEIRDAVASGDGAERTAATHRR